MRTEFLKRILAIALIICFATAVHASTTNSNTNNSKKEIVIEKQDSLKISTDNKQETVSQKKKGETVQEQSSSISSYNFIYYLLTKILMAFKPHPHR